MKDRAHRIEAELAALVEEAALRGFGARTWAGSIVLPLELEPMGVPAAKREFPSDHAAVIVDLRWMRGE